MAPQAKAAASQPQAATTQAASAAAVKQTAASFTSDSETEAAPPAPQSDKDARTSSSESSSSDSDSDSADEADPKSASLKPNPAPASPALPIARDDSGDEDVLDQIDDNEIPAHEDDITLEFYSEEENEENLNANTAAKQQPQPNSPTPLYKVVPLEQKTQDLLNQSGFDLSRANPVAVIVKNDQDALFRAFYLSLINASVNRGKMNEIIAILNKVHGSLKGKEQAAFKEQFDFLKHQLKTPPKDLQSLVEIANNDEVDKRFINLMKYVARGNSGRPIDSADFTKEDFDQLAIFNHYPFSPSASPQLPPKASKDINRYCVIEKINGQIAIILDDKTNP